MPPSRHRRRRPPNRGRSADMAITQPRRKTNYWYVIASAIIALLVIGGFSVGAVIGLLREVAPERQAAAINTSRASVSSTP